jgi:hypothetical protein
MAARIAAGEALGQRAPARWRAPTAADAAMLGASTDCESIGRAGDQMIVNDDAAIDRDTGVSGDAQAGSRHAVANDDERFAHRNPKFCSSVHSSAAPTGV